MKRFAADVYYGLNTFDGVPWGRFSYDMRKKWGVALHLGQTARVRYKGFDLDYYLSHLADAREKTLPARISDWDGLFIHGVEFLIEQGANCTAGRAGERFLLYLYYK